MNDATTRALLRGVKCAWCAILILEHLATPGSVLWSHGLCRECRRWVEAALRVGEVHDTNDVRHGWR